MGYYGTAGDYYFGDPGTGKAATKAVGKLARAGRFVKSRFAQDPGLPAFKKLGKAALRKAKDPFGLGVPGGKGMRRHRRMNVLNARALRKALRRAEGFSRFARRVVRITMPKRRVSGFRFRHRRKRRV